MANYFGVNSSQANNYYQDIVNKLDDIATDTTGSSGRGDTSINLIANIRHQQNGITKHEPWIMSTTEWLLSKPPRGIVWFANPSDVTWSMPQRATHSKTLIGTVLHVWPNNNRGTFFDELKLTFSLQMGNMMPVNIAGNNWQASGGIVNFYEFMQLVDAPKLTEGTAQQPPRTNLVSIQYHSNLFPSLTLLGMFDPAGIRFTDSASSPASVTSWSVDFVVYDTVPKLSTYSGQQSNAKLLQNWLNAKVSPLNKGTPRVGVDSAQGGSFSGETFA